MASEWKRISQLWNDMQTRLWWRHTKARWMKQYANQDVRNLKPIGKGVCMVCGKEDDYVFPLSIEVCPSCIKKNRIKGPIHKAQRFTDPDGRTICTICGKPTSYYFKLNGRVCNKCTVRFGKRVNRGKKELKG